MISVGAAARVINNAVGSYIQGALFEKRALQVHDDLEANALYLSDGAESILLVSCDIIGLESDLARRARELIADRTGIPPRNILIACTHTHQGPSLIPTNRLLPIDTDYISRLYNWLVELAQQAVGRAVPARVGWAAGQAQIGYNRRCCWADGSHTMHGDTTRPDFTGLEGPDDPQHLALFAQDVSGGLLAVLHHNTAHATGFFGSEFYSADYPGAARTMLREELGDVPVLFLNGAFGDISLENMLDPSSRQEPGPQKVARVAALLAGETLRLMKRAQFCDDPVLRHAFEDLRIEVRLPDPRQLEKSYEALGRADAGEEIAKWDIMFAHGTVLLHERYGEEPIDTVPVHAVRIGDVGLATQPCELFCQFGLDIRRRSPAPLTTVASIMDGCGGYCPTTAGIIGGGYSGQPLYWCRLASDAGYRIVDSAAKLLHQLWRD